MKDSILYIIIILLLLCCLINCNSGLIDKVFNNQIDTVITTKSDTIWAKKDTVVFRYKIIDKPYAVYLDTTKRDTLTDNDSIRVYKQEYRDSNLTIFTKDSVSGYLLGQNVRYTLKIPTRIIDSVFVNITKTQEAKKKGHLLVGIGTSEGIQNFNISPMVGFQAPNGRIALYEYNTFSRSHNIKLLVPLSFPKKKDN
jgi:hypothetical protein